MATVKGNALAGLKESLAKTEALINAAEGKESSCAVFNDKPWNTEKWSAEHMDDVRIYVETWIAAPLKAAIDSIEGNREFTNEAYLDGLAGKGWF